MQVQDSSALNHLGGCLNHDIQRPCESDVGAYNSFRLLNFVFKQLLPFALDVNPRSQLR